MQHPIRPQYFFTIDIKLRRGGEVRYEKTNVSADNYDNIVEIATHHCRFLIREKFKIVKIQLTNFRFGPHGFFNYYGSEDEY